MSSRCPRYWISLRLARTQCSQRLNLQRPYGTSTIDSSTQKDGTQRGPGRPLRPYRTPPQTLDPKKLSTTEFLDLARLKELPPRWRFHYSHGYTPILEFPENSRGFLYFNREQGAPTLAASIRFRVTNDEDPSSFPTGHDLLFPNRTTWQILMPTVVSTRCYRMLADVLVRDHFIDSRLLDRFKYALRMKRNSIILYSLHQEFLLDFSHYHLYPWVVLGDETMHRVVFSRFRKDHRPKTPRSIYTGRAIVRFELAQLPRHAGRTLVLRVLRVVEPIIPAPGYDGYIPTPQAGELLMRRTSVPWSIDVDNDRSDATLGLRLLVDAAEKEKQVISTGQNL
ncbi:hypothetical protein JAAARDRAFT_156790 [Jaapia argillacea MUCL 33604]|uniref:Uncharacterized protein n=1 Tax=Jaapia argillacea MUCL 33604 TaxID=933084 RepID=A0A067Q2R3_9AGAM|nr:hypothetical protein JAAARDRAFT_156790 [Jaapia argillacea MUCL 33604]